MSTNTDPFSVTSTPCHCGYLAENAAQLGSPIKFDAELQEYRFEHSYPSGSVAKWIIHHCPMCGGVASQSLRHRLFVAVPEDEVRRLQGLIGSIKTVGDIERVLGKPDLEDSFVPPLEAAMTQPDTQEPEKGPIRVLTYVRLSGTADVQFMAFSNQKVQGTISPKSRESKA